MSAELAGLGLGQVNPASWLCYDCESHIMQALLSIPHLVQKSSMQEHAKCMGSPTCSRMHSLETISEPREKQPETWTGGERGGTNKRGVAWRQGRNQKEGWGLETGLGS